MDLTKLFLIKKFKEYYKNVKIDLPREFNKREFAIVPLEFLPEFVMIRHLSFKSSANEPPINPNPTTTNFSIF